LAAATALSVVMPKCFINTPAGARAKLSGNVRIGLE
jgi:hypothetical protein